MKAMSRSRYNRSIRDVEMHLLRSLEPLPKPHRSYDLKAVEPLTGSFNLQSKTWTLTLQEIAKVQQLKGVSEHANGNGHSRDWTAKVKWDQKRSRLMHRQPPKREAKPKATDHRLDVPMKGGVEEMLAVSIALQEAEAKNAMAEALQNWVEE